MTTLADHLSGPALERCAFEFFSGKWTTKMRRRQVDGDLAIHSDWVSFDATVDVRPIMGGLGYVEDVVMESPEGGAKVAAGCRFYNPKTKAWTIYWARENEGRWDDGPMHGGFATAEGMAFICDDVWDGKPVLTRFAWNTLSPDHPTWEQSFSNDGGHTWVSNWFMEFTRVR